MSLSPEAIRLQRTRWDGKTDLLADELYLILSADRDPNFTPLQISVNDPGFPDLNLAPNYYNPAQDPSPVDFPMLYWPEFTDTPTDTNPGGSNAQFQTKQRVKKTWVRTMLPGKVTNGSRDDYTLNLYPNGVAEEPEEVTGAKVVGGGTVAAGTWVTVYRATHLEVTEDIRIPQNPAQPVSSRGLPQNFGTSSTPLPPAQPADNAAEQVVSVRQKVLSRTHDIMPGGNSTFPAKVVSGGPGKAYRINVYPGGPDGGSTEEDGKQLQIDDTHALPEGSWCLVTSIGGMYYMQIPVWLR